MFDNAKKRVLMLISMGKLVCRRARHMLKGVTLTLDMLLVFCLYLPRLKAMLICDEVPKGYAGLVTEALVALGQVYCSQDYDLKSCRPQSSHG